MSMFRRLLTIWIFHACILTVDAWAGRPLTVDDADPASPGLFEFEIGVYYEKDSRDHFGEVPAGLSYGLRPGVEIGVGFGGILAEWDETDDDGGNPSRREEIGISDLAVGLKWQFIDSYPILDRQAFAGSAKLPTADDEKELGSGKTDFDLTWIASQPISGDASLHLNLGYSWIGGPDVDVIHGGMALDYTMTGSLQWIGEVFLEKEHTDGGDVVVQVNTGLRWNPSESITLDLAGGSRIGNHGPDFTATTGLTWAFGFDNVDKK